LRVCCAPLPAMGSVAFPGARPILSWRWVRTFRFPRRGYPTKSSPRQQPFRIAAVVASLPLPSILPVSPTRLPGLSKYVANKFVGVLRRTDRLAPSRVDRPSSEEEEREWTPDDRGRRASPRSQRDRSHSGRRPKPSESSRVPFAPAEAGLKPPSAEARGGASHLSNLRPPRWASSRSGLRALRALPPSCDACRSRYRGAGCPASSSIAEATAVDCRSSQWLAGSDSRCLPKQVRGVRRVVRCLPKQVRAIRAGVRCRPKPTAGDPRDDLADSRSCLLPRDRWVSICRSRWKRRRPLPERMN
jgi:hypothetical protein